MAFGTVFTKGNDNPRTTAIRAVAKANNLELNFVDADTKNPTVEHLKANPLGKVPAFLGEDGFAVSEAIAVAIYLTSQNEKTTLLGKTKQDYASILKWMSFANTEVLLPLGGWFRPLLGVDPYNKKAVTDNEAAARKAFKVLENHLTRHTYLVGDRITLADLFVAGISARGFQHFFDKEWRQENPATTRWYETIINQPIYSAVAPKTEFLEKVTLKHPEGAAEGPADVVLAAPKPAADAAPAASTEEAPKPKHPCTLLPPTSYNLDDFKRFYSNTSSEDEIMEYFWKTIPWEDYSIWRVDFKYNTDLSQTYMSNNLIGGFNSRLEASRKFLFGGCNVYGKTDDSIIKGAFVIRGQEWEPVFQVSPEWESYNFVKLDPTNEDDKQFVRDMFMGDKPVVYEYATGKCFK